MLRKLWKLLTNYRRQPVCFLDHHADLTTELIEDIEQHVRAIATWLNSAACIAEVHTVRVCIGDDPTVIGLCWTEDHPSGPIPREIWIDSQLNMHGEAQVAIHEYAHAFCDAEESHDGEWRRVYLVAWAVFFNASRRHIRAETKRVMQWYRREHILTRRREVQEVYSLIAQARLQADPHPDFAPKQ